ncbi:WD40-repeat-containing domain protein [Geranomyces variabilis]|nr:WD40-repeat-containing domain protein [Geranomyces variabilis]
MSAAVASALPSFLSKPPGGTPRPDTDGPSAYYLEPAPPIADPEDDDLEYEEVPVEEFEDEEEDGEETLERAVRRMNEGRFFGVSVDPIVKTEETPVAKLTKRPEVIDDYIRNWLSSKGLVRSLDAFQNEWYEFHQRGKLSEEDVTTVPDVYQRNQELADALQKLRVDVDNYKEIASKARATYDKLRKERDFHRMHHKRVVQEKNRLIGDIKRLKKHYESYEPMLKAMQTKYEVAMKEKMLMRLERDRLAGKVVALESTLRQERRTAEAGGSARATSVKAKDDKESARAPATGAPAGQTLPSGKKHSSLPLENRPNPYVSMELPALKSDRMRQAHAVRAHDAAITSMKFHPKKMILATVSDDKTWKMWAFPTGELIMSGSGHKDWIAECDFHPKGAHLATASGDGTVKLWDFAKGSVTATLGEHTQAVWSCAFHDTGDFVVSGSMDYTAKLWDVQTARCRQTFRGHADSVNHVGFLPYSNTIFTCSGDKTISLWDARTGLCSQTLYGHTNAVNCVAVSLKGDAVASCDADGVVKLWDMRNVSELGSMDFGPHPANRVSFDPSGSTVAVASNDGTCRLVGVKDGTVHCKWAAHEDGCQAAVIDRHAEYLVTGGNDGTIRIFQ